MLPQRRWAGLRRGAPRGGKRRFALNPQRRYVFALAERFRCTVAELDERLSLPEFFEWMAYDDYRADQAEED